MSNREDSERSQLAEALDDERRDEAEDAERSSPFDHPAFLPVIVGAFALWFGFDGWFNADIESIRFNRYGFGFLLGAAIYFTLDEYARLPYLLSALWLGYAVWLGAFAMFGAPGDWFYDEPQARLFNRYASLGFLLLAVLAALRELWRRRRISATSPPD
ncbi:MAG: hypothetical protein OEM49_10800 [Myxococcales bacterium]|nr:hypothetical protein [Myxococcales bacterium]MDH5307607.1 hypothetical protein [Myxococcales bacterium]MDH5567087.1 hypothetical protein [Myxococcales bacterium]